MKHSMRSKAFGRLSLMTLAVGLSLAAGTAQAQQSAGSINGRATKGDTIRVENKSLGLSRQIKLDADGSFQLSQLPPGSYQVSIQRADGRNEVLTVVVLAGEGSYVAFGSQLARVEVVGSAIKTLDVRSTESSQVLTKAQIDRIPVQRDVTAITLLAPGAIVGDSRIGQTGSRAGNVASLGGASAAENTYYINGFNVTNIVNGVTFNQVPYEAVSDQRVSTGGYGAEYGRSLGGVISVTTKRGTNEWSGGFNIKHADASLRAADVRALRDPSTAQWLLAEKPGAREETSVNLWGGGPLIKDTLFAFGMVQATRNTTENYFAATQERIVNDTPQYLLKLDWNVGANHLLELTAFNDKAKDVTGNWDALSPYGAERGEFRGNNLETYGGQNVIAKWTSWLSDDLSISALAGLGQYDRANVSGGADCPIVIDVRSSTRFDEGCWTSTRLGRSDALDERKAMRLDAEWTLDKHRLKAGLDHEIYKVRDGTRMPGEGQYVLRTRNPGQTLPNGYVMPGTPGVDPAVQIVEYRLFENGGEFETINSAWYLEDGYQATDRLLLSAGLRNESFTNRNANGEAFIKVKNTWAPRLGMAWDVNGDANLKVYSNLGRYYIPVYSNTNLRLAGAETDYRDHFLYGGSMSNDRYSRPVLGAALGERVYNSRGETPDPRSVVDTDIKPMYQDEFIAGFQKALNKQWTVGMKYTHRKLGSGMDDICSDEAPIAWALAHGYTPDQADAIGNAVANCFLYNPGSDLSANIDLDGNGQLTQVVVPASVLMMPKAQRTYNALEFTFERAWDRRWSVAGSYVLAYSKGNTEGYVRSDVGQDDAGISSSFDFPGLAEGSFGYLPNDRRHTLKLWGSYAASDELRIGANLVIQSGRPRNCLGVYGGTLDTHSQGYGDESFWCGGQLNSRGAFGRLPWTQQLNLQATYTPKFVKGLTLSADLINLFNKRGVRSILEEEGSGMNDANSRYGQPVGLQAARSLRLLAQYEF